MNPDEVRRAWAERSTEYSPDYYAYYGPDDASEEVRRTLDRLVGPDATVMEVGCSSGRHLAHLHRHGYDALHGVDVNEAAFDVMAEEYPAVADAVTFHRGAIEDVVDRFGDGRFEAVFSVETLQHVHADASWVFAELARITDDVLLTVECERPVQGSPDAEGRDGRAVSYVVDDLPLYYRPWDRVFADLGLAEVEARSLGRTTLRAFRHE